jgi:hypothetical protein
MSRTPFVLGAAFTFASFAFGLACGNTGASGPAGPAAAMSVPPAASAAPSSAPPSSAAPEPAPEPGHRKKPFEIYNSCPDVVTVVFGEDPKKFGAGSRTVAASSGIEGPREADGTQWVWLLDGKGEPLIKVHVTKGMKKVEVGRSCRTLDAR